MLNETKERTPESIQIELFEELKGQTEAELKDIQDLADKKREHIDILDFLMAKLVERIKEKAGEVIQEAKRYNYEAKRQLRR